MALIKLAFRSFYFIIYGQIIFLSWLFWQGKISKYLFTTEACCDSVEPF